jgi:hypothetical protein
MMEKKWDRQIEPDFKSGALDFLIDEARNEKTRRALIAPCHKSFLEIF